MSNQQIFSVEETLRLISEKARERENYDGLFSVRISSRRPGEQVSRIVLALKGADAAHFASPEAWLPVLTGGGEYNLRVSHESALNDSIGGTIPVVFPGEPAERLNVEAIRMPGWNGPRVLVFPTPAAQVAAGQRQGPVAASSASAAPQTTQPTVFGGVQIGPTPVQQLYSPPPSLFAQSQAASGGGSPSTGHGGGSADAMAIIQMEARARDEVARRAAELDKERMKMQFDAQIERLRLEIQANRPAPVEQKNNAAELIGAVGPLLLELQKMRQASDLANQQIAREAAERAERLARENQQLTLQMFEKLAARNDPSRELKDAMEVYRMQSSGNAEMMAKIVDATGAFSKISMGMITTMADSLQGPEANPMLEVVREVASALGTLTTGAKSGGQAAVSAQRQLAQARPQLPGQQAQAQAQAQMQARAQAQARLAQAHAQAHVQANGAHGAQQAAPVPVVEFQKPAPPPNMPAVNEDEGPSAFGEMPNAVDQLESMIRKHTDAGVVARFFFQALETPEMQTALEEVEGDLGRLLTKRLGAWMGASVANVAYMSSLNAAVQEFAAANGFNQEAAGEDEDSEEVEGSTEQV